MTANTVSFEEKWKPVLDQVDFPVRDPSEVRKVTAVLLTQDVPDPAYIANTTVHETKLEPVNQMFAYYTEEDIEHAKKNAQKLLNKIEWE